MPGVVIELCAFARALGALVVDEKTTTMLSLSAVSLFVPTVGFTYGPETCGRTNVKRNNQGEMLPVAKSELHVQYVASRLFTRLPVQWDLWDG